MAYNNVPWERLYFSGSSHLSDHIEGKKLNMKSATLLLGLGLALPLFYSAPVSASYVNSAPAALKLKIQPVNNSQTKITGSVTKGSLVKLYQDGAYAKKAVVQSNGRFVINLKSPLSHIGSYQLTATKVNFKPLTESFKVTSYPYTNQIKPLQTQVTALQKQLTSIQSQLSTMQSTADGLTNQDTTSSDYQRALTTAGNNPQAYQATYLSLEQQAIDLQNQMNQIQTQIQHYQDLSNF
jgi:uncharacterized protein YukE